MSWKKIIIYSAKTGRIKRGHPPMSSNRKACTHVSDIVRVNNERLAKSVKNLSDDINRLAEVHNNLAEEHNKAVDAFNNNAMALNELIGKAFASFLKGDKTHED